MLLPDVSSYPEKMEVTGSHSSSKDNNIKMNPRLLFDITLHGFLLWASMGFLLPKDAVLAVTVGAIMSIEDFNNAFNNNHQRVGMALYESMVLSGFRPFLIFLDLKGSLLFQ
ncbi:cytochrome b561 domain-containing protein At2g30890-like [Neltuma alba]|uniref:cytochrome b561 domain-containing protein At2g30890-like n=1 Tax=Neltuma alba TaxID=207710 RepID=UPI0010A3475E|nr:cytochrome b561 domain-containing protein At2g30890-like [Prosopis alba]